MTEKKYIRDKRSPKPKNENVSKVMSANKAKDTSPELLLRRALWNSGLKGYRLHHKQIPGRPDITFPKIKLAIFVNGCFWHRCPHCSYELPKTNRLFWKDKFEKNILRDAKKTYELEELGWSVVIAWECQLKKDMNTIVTIIHKFFTRFGSNNT